MGRTIASITQTWHEEEAALKRFERALRKEDQILLDELLVFSRLHLAEASYASNLYPLDMYLIAILLEVYKKLKSLEKEVHSGKEEPAPELIKEARFLEMLEGSFRQALERPQEAQTVPAMSLGNGLGRIPATVSLRNPAAGQRVPPAEAASAETREISSEMGTAAHTDAAAQEQKVIFTESNSGSANAQRGGRQSPEELHRAKPHSFSAAVHNGSSTHALNAHLSQVSTLSYPPCALSDPAVTLSYATFEDAP
jgi:hypothetical protein